MIPDTVTHRLAFALRANDHFTKQPVGEELAVGLDTHDDPVRAVDGTTRHGDGSYRWIDLAAGPRVCTVSSPSGRWTNFGPLPIAFTLPLVNPAIPIELELWPTPTAAVPAGLTAIRGRLTGLGVLGGVRVSIDGFGAPPNLRWTQTDASGEFLYLLPGGPWPHTATGALDLVIAVTGRSVANVTLQGSAATPGARFALTGGREPRAWIQLT